MPTSLVKIALISVVVSIALLAALGGWYFFREKPMLARPGESARVENTPRTRQQIPVKLVEDKPQINVLRHFFYKERLPGNRADRISLLVTGDVLTARAVDRQMREKSDFTWPFLKTAEFLRQADVVLVNLETPLTKKCVSSSVGMVFCGSLQASSGLKFAGVDVVGVANNHMGNQGFEGVGETISQLKADGFVVTGASESAMLEVKGKKFGFLAYNDVGGLVKGFNSTVIPEQMRSDVQNLKPQVDFVVVLFHWGNEYTYNPTDRQREVGRMAVDLGADLVVGDHPHWVQAVELYKEKVIAYSHGNFVFDQEWSRETKEGVIGQYDFGENGLVDFGFYPVIIEDYGQPRFAAKEEAEKILQNMLTASEKLSKRD